MILGYKPTGYRDFKLSERFLESFTNKQPDWGFGDLSYVTYKRTYARIIEDRTEEYWETVKRVVEGTYNIQKLHCITHHLPWNNEKAQRSAQKMYELMWEFKFLPPGRGLWNMGMPHVLKRGSACLQNCGFISTEDIKNDYAGPFAWSMDMSMLGVGIGFDTKGANTIAIQKPSTSDTVHIVDDSREGWINCLRIVLNAFIGKDQLPLQWDYSQIRKKGSPLKTFGGVASGPKPLREMVQTLTTLYTSYIGKEVDSTLITDTFNISGKCVVSGGIRRTAQIAFGNPDDIDFLNLKLDKEALMSHRWASNNSIFCHVGMDYTEPAKRTEINGEPGYFWLENAQNYGRMIDPPNYKDYRVRGTNPCVEQSLEPWELCCLVEIFPSRHEDIDDVRKTAKYAYLYAKTVTLIPTHDEKTNAVMNRNRRIGCSQSGIKQAFSKFGRRAFFNKSSKTYEEIARLDKVYSEWFGVGESIKTTSMKPSGTVSLVAGVSPGLKDLDPFHIRRVRMADTSLLIEKCLDAGYVVEKDEYAPNTMVVEFPVKVDGLTRDPSSISMWEQLEDAAAMQYYWADNQISATITFTPDEGKQIAFALERFETKLKGVSFLPLVDHGYIQAPYEKIDETTYNKTINKIVPIYESVIHGNTHEAEDKFCDGETCNINFAKE